MSLPIVFRQEAQEELDDAAEWYERKKIGLGLEFINETHQTLSRIAADPQLYQRVHKHVRRAGLARFPYHILYRAEEVQITVFAVFHMRRDPNEWMKTDHLATRAMAMTIKQRQAD